MATTNDQSVPFLVLQRTCSARAAAAAKAPSPHFFSAGFCCLPVSVGALLSMINNIYYYYN